MGAPKETVRDRWLKVMALAIKENWNGVRNDLTFGKEIGMVPQQISHIKSNEKRNVTVGQIEALCKKFGVNANYIIMGMLPIRLGSQKDIQSKLKAIEQAKVILKKASV